MRILPQVLSPENLYVADGPRLGVRIPVAGNHLNPGELVADVEDVCASGGGEVALLPSSLLFQHLVHLTESGLGVRISELGEDRPVCRGLCRSLLDDPIDPKDGFVLGLFHHPVATEEFVLKGAVEAVRTIDHEMILRIEGFKSWDGDRGDPLEML